jgi:hypothetical protein
MRCKEAGCTTELDYAGQTSWLLFLFDVRVFLVASAVSRSKYLYQPGA